MLGVFKQKKGVHLTVMLIVAFCMGGKPSIETKMFRGVNAEKQCIDYGKQRFNELAGNGNAVSYRCAKIKE